MNDRGFAWRRLVGSQMALGPLLALCVSAAAGDEGIRLTDVTRTTGIDFIHTDGSCSEGYIVEQVSAGLALFDYDGDGDIDVYFLNGAPLLGSPLLEQEPPAVPKNALWRNDGNWRFRDVTDVAGVGDPGFGLGVADAGTSIFRAGLFLDKF